MNTVDNWRVKTLGEAACVALRKNGFEATCFDTGVEAMESIAKLAKPGMTVGFGGSMTLRGIGVLERIRELGAQVLDHMAPGLTPEAKLEILRGQLLCDLFLSGSNAVTLKGEIVNVDGNGNRVAALTFGPRKTVVVVGVNKIVRDLDEAFDRIETRAAPMNNRRIGLTNPCVKAGTCQDCQGKDRICNIYQILRRKPSLSDFTVMIICEELGY